MKKFLSLVLTLVMAMSLVTISAGATEYKDLTDKDEIQYEEAVTVLNRLGIITGYSDGSFRPEGELTRGAAAKIIVSLMIGPEAAENLTVSSAPYTDVPVDNNFAAVINYCKTAGFISGYGDGTFRPSGKLTGYAFSKMLLGALGYKSAYEGFEGAGWNMKVAAIGAEAGLFDRVSFKGNEKVTRDVACQLALNTLKGTLVSYSGGMNVSNGDQTIVVNPTRSYKTSNQEFAQHINNKKAGGLQNTDETHYTVEFGEEHFVDLRLNYDGTTHDDFGRPSNEWSYKKVTIGTFPIVVDYSFNKLMEHADKTTAVKNRATGLGGFKTVAEGALYVSGNSATAYTRVWVNGKLMNGASGAQTQIVINEKTGVWSAGGPGANEHAFGVADINDLTDNGTLVEVYVSDDIADFITDVVVVKSQLMEIKKVGSDYVSLQMYDNGTSDDDGKDFPGFNSTAINEKVANVQAEDDCYATLSAMKAGDVVVVVPVNPEHDGKDFEVAEAYKPETVSGTLTAVEDYGPNRDDKNAIALTVGGTVYNASLWNKNIYNIDGDKIKVTKKDVTLTLDKYGYAMLAEDVGATSDFMIVGAFRSGIENNRIVTTVTGWDISGEEIELNLGPNYNRNNGIVPGDLVKYTSATNSNITDWTISETDGVYNVFTGEDTDITPHAAYEIKASNQSIKLVNYGDDSKLYFDKSVKFIYVTFDVDGEVESIEVKSDVQNVENKELRTTGAAYRGPIGATSTYDTNGVIEYAASGNLVAAVNSFNSAQAAVKSDAVKAVVIKQESNDAISSAMLYVRDMPGGAEYDSNGKMVYKYTVAMNGKDGLVDDEMTIYSYDRLYRGDFASYSEMTNEAYSKTPFYSLRQHNDFVKRTTSTFQADFMNIVNENKGYVRMADYKALDGKTVLNDDNTPAVSTSQKASLGLGDEANIGIIKNAVFVDLTGNDIDSYNDLKTFMYYDFANKVDSKVRQNTVTVHMVINDNADNDGFRKVAMVVVTDVDKGNVDNAARDNNTLLTANIKGVSASIPTGGNQYNANGTGGSAYTNGGSVSLTYAQANGSARISFTHNGDKMKVEYAADGSTYAEISNGSTQAVANGSKIKVTVTAVNGKYNVYEFTITAAALSYLNSVSENYKTATNYAANDWNDGTEVKIDSNGNFVFPFLNNGVEADTKAQLVEALEYYNAANASDTQFDVNSVKKIANGVWTVDLGGAVIKFLESDSKKVLAGIDSGTGTVTYGLYANNAQLGNGLSLAAITKEVNLAGDVVWHETVTGVVTPGSVYTSAAGAKLTVGTASGAKAGLFDVTFVDGDGNTIASGDIVEKNTVVKIVATAKADIDLAAEGGTTAVNLTFAANTTGDTVVFSGAASLVNTNTGGVLTFKQTGTVAAGDTITFSHTVTAAEVNAKVYDIKGVVIAGA